MKTAKNESGSLVIRWSGVTREEWGQILDIVRELPGRKFDTKKKTWSAPVTEIAINALRDAGFEVCGIDETVKKEAIQNLPELLETPLKPYQVSGVEWLVHAGSGLLADEMGLGKTIQAIYWSQIVGGRTLVICPASLKLNWQVEYRKWLAVDASVISGGQAQTQAFSAQVVIINYDICATHCADIIRQKFDNVILDECHYIKNPKAQRTEAVKKIVRSAGRLCAISGTPITNRPIEFFTVLNLLDKEMFSSKFAFAQKYCDAKHNGWGWDFSGSSNPEELNQLLRGRYMLRRKKADVLTDLPAKQFATQLLPQADPETRSLYVKQLQAVLECPGDILREINALRQLAGQLKLDAMIDWIKTFIESGEKLVVFAVHHAIIDELEKTFRDCCTVLDGRKSQQQKQEAVRIFQEDPECKLFIGNIQAAGVGITLTAASNVAFAEYPWTPGELAQAVDRCHRIGQTDSVTAWLLIAQDTFEETLVDILAEKTKTLDAIIDGKNPDETPVLRQLLQKLKNKE